MLNRAIGRGSAQIATSVIMALDERSKEIFRNLVDTYLATGEPVGSRSLSKQLPMSLSPASVRNVMSDLEDAGLIYAPHTSAGRLPTHQGLRLFVDGMLEIGDLHPDERRQIESEITNSPEDRTIEQLLAEASDVISGLSECAGVVLTDKQVARFKQVEFVPLDSAKALVVLVGEDGTVENRIIDLPAGLPPSAMEQARNYLNTQLSGLSINEAREKLRQEQVRRQKEIDDVVENLIGAGIAAWSGEETGEKTLIVRGRSNLISEKQAAEDIELVKKLFDDMEAKKDLAELLGLAEQADGVRIFIGAENQLFSMSGSSVVVSPFKDKQNKIVGVLGVIGPTRLNYGRIIPMVDYTAKVVSRLLA